MRQIVKATIVEAQLRWRQKGCALKVWFDDGETAERYVGTADVAHKVATECLERGERYFWELAQD
jgi:hypothetical protein